MIKCIAIDMDGTLLTPTEEITQENEMAIKKAQKEGIEVVVATGRSYEEASFVLKEAGIQCPIICVNGAEIRSMSHEIVDDNPLEKSIARQAAQALFQNDVYFEVYTNRGTFTVDVEKGIAIIMDILVNIRQEKDIDKIREAAEERFHKGQVHKVDSYEVLFDKDEYKIYKLLAFSFDLEKLSLAKRKLEKIEGLVISASGEENLELTSEKAQKGVALEAFVKGKGIALSDVMAIGDNYNDLSMFIRVGRAVAMGNAPDEIKKQCHFVTETNEESGVGKAIMKVLQDEILIKK
ncbi:HAD family hydrolase [Bacillus sp. 03113]|uniref:HAD family hydrolase n=1 Tax=Bacillus sp. 03113 TaxID=2578211 RepID=UPI0011442476|nr:HAD family hydrolase [Bacillus sp. 03113]